MIFTGYYEHSIDAKNRLAIPSKIRGQLNARKVGKALVLVPGQPPNTLWLYTQHQFEQLAGQVDSALIPDDDRLPWEQVFFSLAEYLEPDTQGRILLPERMLARAGLERDVVICGVRDHLEIWPRQAFEEIINKSWQNYREVQLKARSAYHNSTRHAPEPPSTTQDR